MSGTEDPGAPVRVLVVDDQELVRKGIASLLGIQPGVTVVATATDGRQAVGGRRHPPAGRRPGRRPDARHGRHRHHRRPRRVVMLTTFDDQAYVARALTAGAVGYLLKSLPSAELARSVRLVHAGVAQLDTSVMARLAATLTAAPDRPGPAVPAPEPAPVHQGPGPAEALTAREVDVLRLIAGGSANREIASRLFLSEDTVKNHISRILGRLGLRDRTQAALYARDHGLL